MRHITGMATILFPDHARTGGRKWTRNLPERHLEVQRSPSRPFLPRPPKTAGILQATFDAERKSYGVGYRVAYPGGAWRWRRSWRWRSWRAALAEGLAGGRTRL